MILTELNPNVKLADLVDRNYQVLGMLERLGITGNFGDSTVEEACKARSMDPGTFLMLYCFYIDDQYKPSKKALREGSIADVIQYLHLSHEYYLDVALKSLSDKLSELIEPCSDKQKKVIWKFYRDYEEELNRHFDYEERIVMPYIRTLLENPGRRSTAMDSFADDHNSINEKISDLKSLVMKSLPEVCESSLRMQALYQICSLEYDLSRHTAVEEEILEPMVRLIGTAARSEAGKDECEEEREALSEREKEILVGVAKGLLNKEIADQYNISIYTVISHRKNITRKTGIKSVAGLTVYALLNGLIDINSVE